MNGFANPSPSSISKRSRGRNRNNRMDDSYNNAISRSRRGSSLLWETNNKLNNSNTSYYERISNVYHNNKNSYNNGSSPYGIMNAKSRKASQAANGKTWQNVLENGLQLPSNNNKSRGRSMSPNYNNNNNTSPNNSYSNSPNYSNNNNNNSPLSSSDYRYNNHIQALRENQGKLIVPTAKAVYSPSSRQQVALYMEQQQKYKQGRRKSKVKYKRTSPSQLRQEQMAQRQIQKEQALYNRSFKRGLISRKNTQQQPRMNRNRSKSPQQDTPEYSERKLLQEIKELAAGVRFTPSRAVGLGDMVIELSSRWRSSTTLALKTIAQLEQDLTVRFDEQQRLSKRLRNTDMEYSKLKDKQELAYNFLKDKKLMDEFQAFLNIYGSSNHKKISALANDDNNNEDDEDSKAKRDLQVKVEALSAAVRDGDSKLVSKFFDHLETENGDDKLNLDDSSSSKVKKTPSQKMEKETETKKTDNNDNEEEKEQKDGENNKDDEEEEDPVKTKEELMEKYFMMAFLTMEYIPKSIKDDRKEIIELTLKHGNIDEVLGNKIRSMPFNSSDHIPESVRKDRENGLKLLTKYGNVLEQMAKEAIAGGMSLLSAPPIKTLVKVQSRRYENENFIPIAVQQDRRSFLSFLFEEGDASFNRVKEALELPYSAQNDIPTAIQKDRLATVEHMFGKIDLENNKILSAPIEIVENAVSQEKEEEERGKEAGVEEEEGEFEDKSHELVLEPPSIELTSTVNQHPFDGDNNIPPEVKQDRQTLLSKIYDSKQHTIKSLVSIVTDRFDGGVDVPEMVNEDRIKCLSILYSEDIAHLVQVQSQPFGGMAKAPAVVLRDRQKTVQMILEDDDFDDDDYNRIIAMPFDQKKQVPESIVQDRMKTIHILMKRYDLTPEEIREEELEHARKVAQKQLEQLPFSGLVELPASVTDDREESLEIIYNVQEYSEQQIRHLVLASPYAGSTFIPEAILTDRHARLALLLRNPENLLPRSPPSQVAPQSVQQQVHQQSPQIVHQQQVQQPHHHHPNHPAPQLASPPQNNQQEFQHSSPQAFPEQQVSPQQHQQPKHHHPNHQAPQLAPAIEEPTTQAELEKVNALLSAPYAGSPIIPDAVLQDRQESLHIIMGDSDLEVEALIEIILKKPYNGSDRIPQSILNDRNAQLEILLNEDGDADKDLQENVTKEEDTNVSAPPLPPPSPPPANVHEMLQQQQQEQQKEEERNVKINQETIIEEKKEKKTTEMFASDRISNMKKVLYQSKPLKMTPASINEDRKAVISIVMSHKGNNMKELVTLVKGIKYANSPYIPEDVMTFRKDLLEAFHGSALDNIDFSSKAPQQHHHPNHQAPKLVPETVSTPKDEKRNALLKLEKEIMGLKYADDDKVPDTVTTDRNFVFSKVKEMVDLDQLVTVTVDDETVNKVAKVVLTELDFQQIPASDAPDDVHDDRMKVLKVLFPGVSINLDGDHEDNDNKDAEVSDNAIEDRMAKAERLLALKEQAFKDLERSTLEGLL